MRQDDPYPTLTRILDFALGMILGAAMLILILTNTPAR